MVERLFLAVVRGCLRSVIVVFPDYTHLLFYITILWTFLCLFDVAYEIGKITFYIHHSKSDDDSEPELTPRCLSNLGICFEMKLLYLT